MNSNLWLTRRKYTQLFIQSKVTFTTSTCGSVKINSYNYQGKYLSKIYVEFGRLVGCHHINHFSDKNSPLTFHANTGPVPVLHGSTLSYGNPHGIAMTLQLATEV